MMENPKEPSVSGVFPGALWSSISLHSVITEGGERGGGKGGRGGERRERREKE